MKIDRIVQRRILEVLASAHPKFVHALKQQINDVSEDILVANCDYLDSHGLIKSGYELKYNMNWQYNLYERPHKITAKGIDFLLDDGGLGAILGVVTVRLDAGTIKALIQSQIDKASDITHEDKSLAKKLLASAGDQGIRKLVDTLLAAGLQAIPNTHALIGMLQGLLK